MPVIKDRMVCGFMFSYDRRRVALIRKTHPDWQKGKLNGIGGHVKDGEALRTAMAREFEEETGYSTISHNWIRVACLTDTKSWMVQFFCCCGDVDALKTVTDEVVWKICLSDISPSRIDLIDNLCWLIPLAIRRLEIQSPSQVEAIYE